MRSNDFSDSISHQAQHPRTADRLALQALAPVVEAAVSLECRRLSRDTSKMLTKVRERMPRSAPPAHPLPSSRRRATG
jgi:hypothetical protein